MGIPSEMSMDHTGKLIMKLCTSCHQELPSTSFSKMKKAKDGLRYECRKCDNARRYEHQKGPGRAAHHRRVIARRAIKRGLPYVGYTAQDIYEREQGICSICNLQVDPQDYHIDHIIPLQVPMDILLFHCVFAHPGDVPWNVTVAHPACNSSKGNRMTSRDLGKYYELRDHYGK